MAIRLYVFLGGMAALSWEILWQLEASLATGVSAVGTALTLSATMGGMTLGSLVGGRVLESRTVANPLLIYGLLELSIGVAGLVMLPGFHLVEWLDGRLYALLPSIAPIMQMAGITLVIGVPTFAMGATIPALKLVARRHGTSLAVLYGMNTGGAAVGTLVLSFILLPELGVSMSVVAIAGMNLTVFGLCVYRARAESGSVPVTDEHPRERSDRDMRLPVAGLIVFTVGFATFGLEIAWFRALRAAFQSTTDSFAIMLASVLIPLALSARAVPWLRRRGLPLAGCLVAAGVTILLVTPLVERVDQVAWLDGAFWTVVAWRMLVALCLLSPPVLLLGVALPWVLDEFHRPREAGLLYAINTVGAVLGSVAGAWILLPGLGFARSSWGLALSVLVLSVIVGGRGVRLAAAVAGGTAVLVAFFQTSSLGRDRILAHPSIEYAEIVAFDEAPDSTVAVVEGNNGQRYLVIDGTLASGDFTATHYMEWMGSLPVLLHPDPANALVICFGSGQTAYTVVQEGAEHLDIVDVSETVLSMAPLFEVNGGVLEHERVRSVVMDGRAWLRRSGIEYDVITLEPMPPDHAGVNALYSKEFYEYMKQSLRTGGVVAQWLPLYLVSKYQAASIAATFADVFPDAILWMDPETPTGILLGRGEATGERLGSDWPGIRRSDRARRVPAAEIAGQVVLDRDGLVEFGSAGTVITDDNQLLAKRRGFIDRHGVRDPEPSLALIRGIAARAK